MQPNDRIKEKLNMAMRNSMALVIMIAICLSSVVTVMAQTVPVKVVDNGSTYTFEVTNPSVKGILKHAVVTRKLPPIKEDDIVSFNDKQGTVTIRRTMKVSVLSDGVTVPVSLNYGDTVADALKKANVSVQKQDTVKPSAETKVKSGMKITVSRNYNVNITADGKTQKVLVPSGDVASALKAAEIICGKEDTLNVKKEFPIYENMEIVVNRIGYHERTKKSDVDFDTRTEKTDSLFEGESKVKTEGKKGERTIVIREKTTNGKVTESKEISNKITREPVDKVILKGTKSRPARRSSSRSFGSAKVGRGYIVDHNGRRISFKRAVTGPCTAYTGGGTTATGRPAAFGNIAVDPREIPYGTRLYVCSPDGKVVYGYATAADTGGFVNGGYIKADLYYDTESQCEAFGVRQMTLYVL